MKSLKVGLIGAGSMGRLHAKTVHNHPDSKLEWVFDTDLESASSLASQYSSISLRELRLGDVDAVIVATPTDFHLDYCLEAISVGTSVLVEKPATPVLAQTKQLVDAAMSAKVALLCGLLERFNPALMTAFDLVEEPLYFRSVRHSHYVPRITTGVAEDLVIHDLDVALRLMNSDVLRVVAASTTVDYRSRDQADDIVEALIRFSNGGIASLSASRVSQHKIRQVMIGERDRIIEVDLLRQTLTTFRHVRSELRSESPPMFSEQTISELPGLRYQGEPLAMQWEHFLRAIQDPEVRQREYESIVRPHEVLERVITASRQT